MPFAPARRLACLLASTLLAAACGAGGAGAPSLVDGGAQRADGGRSADDGGRALDDGGAAFDDGGAALDDGGAAFDDGGAAMDDGGPRTDGGAPDAGAGCPLPTRDGGPLNPGWIGGPCTRDTDCAYDGGVCLTAAEGFPQGQCSQACTSTCPDRAGPDNSVTFCVTGSGRFAGSGVCVSKCDYTRAPLGCREGYRCETATRHTQATTYGNVCRPGTNTCAAQASAACVDYRGTANPLDMPATCPGELCDMENAMVVTGPIGGIVWRNLGSGSVSPLYLSCPLALALEKLAPILHDLNVVEVSHIGTYNCRQIAGTNCSLSQHAYGLAIDLGAFKLADGGTVSVLNDWLPTDSIPVEPRTDVPCRFRAPDGGTYMPTEPKARFLYELAYRMCDARIWSIILTPNYNAAHDNHFHVDLTAGYSRTYVGHPGPTVLRAGTAGE